MKKPKRKEIVKKIIDDLSLPKGGKTQEYFTRAQLVELSAVIDFLTLRKQNDREECNQNEHSIEKTSSE